MKYKYYDSDSKSNVEVSIDEKNLIKPEDLSKHLGEVLEFHNGLGYVVTGILTEAKIYEWSDYDFGTRYSKIEYEDELDMDWFYCPKSEISEYETIMYAYEIVIHNCHCDEIMHNIKYIAVPSKDALDFRNKLLGMDKSELDKRYNELKNKYY